MNIDFDKLRYSLTGEYEEVMLEKEIEKKDKEIERLNNIIEEIIKICEENEYLTLIKDIKRLKDSDKVE